MNSLQQYIDLYNANRDAIERNAPHAMNALRPEA